MQDDTLGQFPKPVAPTPPVEPVPTQPAPINDAPQYHDPFAVQTPPLQAPIAQPTSEPQFTEPAPSEPVAPPVPAFEETPEEIPSVQSAYATSPATPTTPILEPTPSFLEEKPITPEPVQDISASLPEPINVVPEPETPLQPEISQTPVDTITPDITASPAPETPTPEITATEPITPPTPVAPPVILQPSPATLPASSGPSLAPIIFIGLLLIAGIGLAASVFLFSQSAQLKRQLTDITQTLNKQDTTITPTPTSMPIEVLTPSPIATPTPDSTISASPTPIATPTQIIINSATPLLYAKQALRVALNKEPNAQLILIKTENASDPANSITKYFFRQDLTTKKYFYVTVLDKSDPAIIDKAIYVTPDNDIPSLNEAVSSESFGIDLDQALKLSYEVCTSGLCQTANLKAQFIKSNGNYIWQLSFAPLDTTKSPLIIQIDSVKKEVLYKSAGF